MSDFSKIFNRFSIIKQIALFSQLTWFQLHTIAQKSVFVEYKKGDILCREGTPPDAFYCLISGRLQSYNLTSHGKKENLEYLFTGIKPIEFTDVKPEDLAEIVYTSGTTGDPKGVMLTHKNLISNLLQVIEHIEPPKNSVFLSLLPLSHMFEQICGFVSAFYLQKFEQKSRRNNQKY